MITKMYRRLRKDLLLYGFMSALSKSTWVILLPILVRQLSPEEYGIFDIVLAFSAFLSIIITFSLESAVMRFWNEIVEFSIQQQFYTSILGIITLMGALIVFFVYIFSDFITSFLLQEQQNNLDLLIIFAAIAAWLQAMGSVPQVVLRMQRKIFIYNLILFAHLNLFVSFSLVGMFIFNLSLVGVLYALVMASLVSLLLSLYLTRDFLTIQYMPYYVRSAMYYSLPLIPAVFASWVSSHANKAILLIILGSSSVGIYGASVKLAGIVGLLVYVFQQAWTPLSIDALRYNEKTRNFFYIKTLNIYMAVMFGIASIVALNIEQITEIILSEEYKTGSNIVPWLVGALILRGSGSITSLGTIMTKKTIGNSYASWIGMCLNFLGGVLLVPMFGISGAAIAVFIGELAFTVMLWWFSWKLTYIDFSVLFFLITIFSYILIVIFGVN